MTRFPWIRTPKSIGVLGFLVLSLAAIDVTARPPAVSSVRMAYDQQEERMILFGGVTKADSSGIRYFLDQTWFWSGNQWIQLFPEHRPAGRSGHGMVYDANRGRIVMFGGLGSSADRTSTILHSDTWFFDNGDWTQIATPNAPSGRHLFGSAFDVHRDRFVIFGGIETGGTLLYDTWEFDGTTWTKTNADGPKLKSVSMAYDEARGQMLLLGWNEKNETEMYQLVSSNWEKLAPAHLPVCINQGQMVYETRFTRIVFAGGGCTNQELKQETWLWHGSDWDQLVPVNKQGFISSYALGYDRKRFETILFGGLAFFTESGATYRFHANEWEFVNKGSSPGPRSQHVFEPDPSRGVSWLYGGRDEDIPLNDLWKLQGILWEKMNIPDTPFCDLPVGTFDTDRNRLVLFCSNTETYEFDGEKWYKFDGLKDVPSPRRWSSMVYDPKSKKSILYGGFDDANYQRDTWSWNGSVWTRISKDRGPKARSLATMFWDPNSQKILLFGGIGRPSIDDRIVRYGDMWSFDGTTWVEMKDTQKPPARYGASARYSPASDTVVMFGGKNEQEQYLNEQWEWNGTAWAKVEPQNPPPTRMNFGMTVDPVTQRLTLFGGYSGHYLSDLWSESLRRWTVHPDVPRQRGTRRPASTEKNKQSIPERGPVAAD